ncbi:hypothetical protein [Hymenobacter bucti]|uniref:Uncharacterized protein n=1 Tax=Hymenobacter bucti TaxID=1844114 RepID=A0ABW4QXX3_9BACT
MNYSEDIERYLVDLWHPGMLPGEQELVEEAPDGRQGPVFKLTGWRGAGWRIVFLDEPAE